MIKLRLLFILFLYLTLAYGRTRKWKTTFVRKSWTKESTGKWGRIIRDGYTNMATTFFDTKAGFTSLLRRNHSTVSLPLLVRFSLCKLFNYASGDAWQQINEAFSFRRKYSSCNVEVSEIMALLAQSTFMIVNKIFLQMSDDINPQFVNEPTEMYGVHVEKYTLERLRSATMYINNWFEENTLHRISGILKRSELGDKSYMLLLSAGHIKPTWSAPFNMAKTEVQTFRAPMGRFIKVPMMYSLRQEYYFRDEENHFEIVTIRLFTQGLTMSFILPETIVHLPNLMYLFAKHPEVLDNARKNMTWEVIEVMIPRFKIRESIDWTPVLREEGISEIFDSKSSGLERILRSHSDISNMFVNLIKQQTFLEVDEYGAMRSRPDSGEMYDKTSLKFVANRPFLFTIDTTVTTDGDHATLLTGAYYGI